jgi:hypothetical protein
VCNLRHQSNAKPEISLSALLIRFCEYRWGRTCGRVANVRQLWSGGLAEKHLGLGTYISVVCGTIDNRKSVPQRWNEFVKRLIKASGDSITSKPM